MSTRNGKALASILSEWLGSTGAIAETCSRICRNGVTLDRLACEECSGPSWIDKPWATPEKVRAWQDDLDKRDTAARRRLVRAVFALPETEHGPIGVQLGGDPRGFVVVLVVPTGRDSVGIGINADGSPYRGAIVEGVTA